MRRLLRSLLGATLVVALTALPGAAQPQPGDSCPSLAGHLVASDDIGLPSGGATITSAQLVAATPQGIGPNGTVIPERPTYCEVQGTIAPIDPAAPAITFQINLPVDWNGKAVQYGGGGFNGVLITGLDPLRDDPLDAPLPITRGYATFGTDSGHQAAAYPPTELAAFSLNDEALTNQLGQLNGGWINPDKAAMVARAVTDACDDLDGLVDGVVNNYIACPANFNPGTLRCPGGTDTGDACLSDAQIRALEAAHAPYRFPFGLANGVLEYPQWLYGGESTPAGLRQWVVGDKPPSIPVTVDGPRWWLYGGNTIRYFIARDPTFDLRTYDPRNFAERVQEISALMDSTGPDLSAFYARGGKLIVRENAGDYAQGPLAGIRYYSSVVARVGQPTVDEFMRLYVSPASNHSGQMRSTTDQLDVPTWVDLLDPLDRWATTGQAPEDALIQTRSAVAPPFEVLGERPMCRYPNYPHYLGGDRSQATSYQCAPSTP